MGTVCKEVGLRTGVLGIEFPGSKHVLRFLFLWDIICQLFSPAWPIFSALFPDGPVGVVEVGCTER